MIEGIVAAFVVFAGLLTRDFLRAANARTTYATGQVRRRGHPPRWFPALPNGYRGRHRGNDETDHSRNEAAL